MTVLVSLGDGRLAAAFLGGGEAGTAGNLVHALVTDPDPAALERVRSEIRASGGYGAATADRLAPGGRLPYIDNCVNLLVAENLGEIPEAEVLRVLVPGGAARVKGAGGEWLTKTKPRPDNIDDWTHYLHDSSGNSVAQDDVVGPPRHLQWLGAPRWSRHHDRMASMSAMVSAGGRVFYIMDEGSRVSIQMPADWKVVARDAFNGTLLWKRDIPKWHSHLWPLKSGPTQLARRLVAVDDRVYVTLSLDAPLTALDAATGETVTTFEKSAATEEILVSEGQVFAVVNEGESELTSLDYAPKLNLGDQRRVANEFKWNEQPRQIASYDPASGRQLWSADTRVAPLTLAAKDGRVVYHDGEKLVCRDAETGTELWVSAKASRRQKVTFNFGPRVVLYGDVVLFAGGERTMSAYDAKTGERLWGATHDRSGYLSPEDLLVSGGLVWSAPTTSTRDSGVYTGRDPQTGEVRREFPPDVETYWFHHRCYIAKATERFLLPSRTGIEFVDPAAKEWEIHHWVRGGCLYGIMPCNGLVYAPPHNCACYPEAKLYGMNALAPASPSRAVTHRPAAGDASRLEKGPAYAAAAAPAAPAGGAGADGANNRAGADWPTYRGDNARSGRSRAAVPAGGLGAAWRAEIGGELSSPVIAGGRVYVARLDDCTVRALDASTGGAAWTFTAGGRVDSPPTVAGGRVVFGSADGFVYCLRASDGALAWRFRAAPVDRRLVAFGRLESVWPVHGSVLVEDGSAAFVAGRSAFLDGGLRFFRLDLATGKVLAEEMIDERDPETGGNLQARLQVLNMPVALPDVLSSDGRSIYMRSQRLGRDGVRVALGPHSGVPAEQGAVQRGEEAHLFSPTGFLDSTYFHRSYWVYGRSFAGGHGGYHQAGKFAPSGRLLVFDEDSVYGFARKPEYYKWTTVLEHHLYAAPKEPPETPPAPARQPGRNARRGGAGSLVSFTSSPSLNPAGKALTVEAWAKADKQSGVVLARGGPAQGYALVFRQGKPQFVVRVDSEATAATAEETAVGRWVHLAGTLGADGAVTLYVDGRRAAAAKAAGPLTSDPQQGLEIGADATSAVGDYTSPLPFAGNIDEVRIFTGALGAEEIAARGADPRRPAPAGTELVLACSFDRGDAADKSGQRNHGRTEGVKPVAGKFGSALRFSGKVARASQRRPASAYLVKHHWTRDIPLHARAMALAEKTLFVAGPPDIVDEAASFNQLVERDAGVQDQLAAQAAALAGADGALLRAVAAGDGEPLAELKLDALPVWDGLAAAGGRLFLANEKGEVVCFRGER